MSKLLMVIDMQNDFITGALGTPEAVKIVPNVVRKIKEYREAGSQIVFTKDTHFKNYLETEEGKNLPVEHCIKGTAGWEICDEIKAVINLDECTVYEKLTFGSSEYAMDLSDGVYEDVEEIELVGLCTDICVISNAMITKTFLTEVKVSVDSKCCAGVTPESHNNALEAMKMCQINIIILY